MDVWQEATDNWSDLCVAMGCRRVRASGALIHTYPINRSGSFYNSVFVQNARSFAIEQVERAYAEQKLPFAIILPRLKDYEELANSLEQLEYSLAPPWMLMTLRELSGDSNPEVSVEAIDRSKLEDWFELQDAFPHAESSKPTRLEMIRKVSMNNSTRLLLASIQGRPVGAGLLFMKDHVASIHMIATLFSFRRRHVATTVTLDTIRRSKKKELVWLRTRRGGTGEKVYTKIGFEVFADILAYTKTPQDEDSNLPPK